MDDLICMSHANNTPTTWVRTPQHKPIMYICSLPHLFTHSPVHLFTHSPVHPFTCSPIHLFILSPVHPFTCSSVQVEQPVCIHILSLSLSLLLSSLLLLDECLFMYEIFLNYFNKSGVIIEDIIKQYIASLIKGCLWKPLFDPVPITLSPLSGNLIIIVTYSPSRDQHPIINYCSSYSLTWANPTPNPAKANG